MRTPFALVLLSGLVITTADAASFDCTRANSWAEKTICANQQLSDLDDLMIVSYKKALARASTPDTVKAKQRDWLAHTRGACANVDCLKLAYQTRLAELNTTVPTGSKGIGAAVSPALSSAKLQTPDDERQFVASYQSAVAKLRQAGSAETRAGAEAQDNLRGLLSSLNGKTVSNWTCRYTSPSRTNIPFINFIDPCVSSGDSSLRFMLVFDNPQSFSIEVYPDDVMAFAGVVETNMGTIKVHVSDIRTVQKGP